MKTNLLIVILLIFNITYSQTDTVKKSKVSISGLYVENIQIVDRSLYPNKEEQGYIYYQDGTKEPHGLYKTKYKTTFTYAININLLIKIYKNFWLISGINTFSEKIKNMVEYESYKTDYTRKNYDIWSNTYLTIPIEFSYNLKFKGLGLYPYLGANFNALFRTTHETDFAPGETELPYIEINKRRVFHSRIFVGFVGGLAISKRIYKRLDLLLKMNYQPPSKVLLVDNTEVYSGVNTLSLGVGLNYNF